MNDIDMYYSHSEMSLYFRYVGFSYFKCVGSEIFLTFLCFFRPLIEMKF